MVTRFRLYFFYFTIEDYEELKSNNRVNDKIPKKRKAIFTEALSRSS